MMLTIRNWFIFVISFVSGCQCNPKRTEPVLQTVSKIDIIKRGRSIYLANCTSCHNVDPSAPGAVGPEVIRSSVELLEARILRAEYPAGYTPKRASRSMPVLRHLEREIPSIHAFLNADQK